jgi:two-component system, cell cycle response regulator CtrA
VRVLVIEGDPLAARVLEKRLTRERISVHVTGEGEEGYELVRRYPFDLALLDLRLPDMSGTEVLRRMKFGAVRVPAMVLSDDPEPETRLRCFSLGADDYLLKPFHGDELIARARAIVRRRHGHATSHLEIGDLSIDMQRRQAYARYRPVPLTEREYQLLEILALRRGKTVAKDVALTLMYGDLHEPDAQIIDVYICKIRRKLLATAPDLSTRIDTIWGRGYALTAEAEAPDCRSSTETARHEAPRLVLV